MKHLVTLTICFCLTALFNCKSKTENNIAASSAPADTLAEVPEEYEPPLVSDIIDYSGTADDSISQTLSTFSPLAAVYSTATRYVYLRDSLESARQTQDLDPQDSLIFAPYQDRAYQAILDYKKTVTDGLSIPGYCPNLLQVSHILGPADSSDRVLPSVKPSSLLAGGNFFFLGGRPFIDKMTPEGNDIFKDPAGNPEARFSSNLTQNTNFLLTTLFHFKKMQANITFGPPLGSYDFGPIDVRGIGSLIHEFTDPVPVYLLTEGGVVPARLTGVTIKPVPQNLGCISDQPNWQFSCSKNLEANEIFGIYISPNNKPLTACRIDRKNDALWTADLDNDGIPEIACVSGLFAGISSDALAECLWFVNVNGTWKIIDAGSYLDCT